MKSWEFLIEPLTPKSAIFISPFMFSRIFCGLMSLWIIFFYLWRYSRPLKSWTVITPIVCSGIFEILVMMEARLPAFMYSNAIETPYSVKNAPYIFRMLGWSHRCSSVSSDMIASRAVASFWRRTSFSAITFLDGLWIAFLTQPEAPHPNLLNRTISESRILIFFISETRC